MPTNPMSKTISFVAVTQLKLSSVSGQLCRLKLKVNNDLTQIAAIKLLLRYLQGY